jgi:hypothetical protein
LGDILHQAHNAILGPLPPYHPVGYLTIQQGLL